MQNNVVPVKENIKEAYKKINPPFGYFGSKNKIALELCENLPPHNCWVEAFCGSAALTLAKRPAPIEIINDIDSEIINLFQQLRKNSKELSSVIDLTPYAAQELTNARIVNKDDEEVERARKFLVQSMMAVNGVFGEDKGGFSSSNSYSRNGKEARVNRWNSLPKRFDNVVERLKNVRIENKNAITLLKKFWNRPATLVYLDPPYFAERSNGYKIDAKEKDFHRKLLDLANRAKCMIFISGYENELYDSIITTDRGWEKRKIETSTQGSNGNVVPRTEVVWMNKPFNKALRTNRIPIRLTKKERKNKKLNPERK